MISKKSKSKSPPKNQPSSPRNNQNYLLTNIIAPPIKTKNIPKNIPNIIINKPLRGNSQPLPPINRLSPVLQTNNQPRRGNSLPTRTPTGLASKVIGSPRVLQIKNQHHNIKPIGQRSTSSGSSNRNNRTKSI